MKQSALAIAVLGMLCNDYEAPQTIADVLSRELERPVSEAEARAALIALVKCGWAQAFVFEESLGHYVPVGSTDVADETSEWFIATPEGKAIYEITAR